ncbi:SAM-dependent methyltransferase [Bradyrhizobium sp.]|uniref:SAM-dependent methyltransferase n=1 Tax=Bradyrhizobium sp. TaxID=376 RepID=UPI003C778EF4
MSGFSADWLTLREPYDLRARNPTVLDAVAAALKPRSSIRVVDLASGTGSTLRALNPHLPARQNWTLIDNDLDLLTRATATPLAKDVSVIAVPLDLNSELEAALDRAVDLVTISALLDLVSDTWLERLAGAVAARSIPLYAALSYDGRAGLTPSDPFDSAIFAEVNAHQLTDKGFGPALGPAAAAFAIARLEALGYSVVQGTSDWVMRPDDRDMQTEILAGWASAALDMGGLPFTDVTAWLKRRRDAAATERSSLHVGHVDFFATPSATR